MKLAATALLNIGWYVLLVIAGFDLFGNPTTKYISNFFVLYTILFTIAAVVHTIFLFAPDDARKRIFESVCQARLESKIRSYIADFFMSITLLTLFVVGWYPTGIILLWFLLIYYGGIAHHKTQIFEKIKN